MGDEFDMFSAWLSCLFTHTGKLDHLNVFLLDARTINCQNVHFNIVVFTKTQGGEVR